MTAQLARILVIDDTPANLMTLCSVLESDFDLQFATSGPSGIALAMKNPPDLVLLDVMMPEVDGFETFKRMAMQLTLREIPVIFVTALNDVDSEVAGLSLGAADYITKPINVTIARHRIRNLVLREQLRKEVVLQRDLLHKEIAKRLESEERVLQLALHDTLTGLPNRRMLSDRLNQAMAASKRSGLYGALMFLDLDNFKSLNDTHGHEIGDLLLIEVAKRLTECVRKMDTVVRFGGDEFVVMLRELDSDKVISSEQAALVAEKIRTSLSADYKLLLSLPEHTNKIIKHKCSASIGVVLFKGHKVSESDMLKWADTVMYQVKAGGRNGVKLYQPN